MMIEINLLPKEFRKKTFDFSLGRTGVYFIGGAVGIIIMLFSITFYQKSQLSELESNIQRAEQRASMLRKDIQVVDALMDVKDKISDRMRAVERLDRHRSAWVSVLQDISYNVPEFIWLGHFSESSVKKSKKPGDKPKDDKTDQSTGNSLFDVREVTLEGYAFTLNALAKLMINLMRSDYFDEVELVSTEEKKLEGQKVYNFVINSRLHFLSDEELRGMIAKTSKTRKNGKSNHKVLN